MKYRNRITGHGEERPADILANPFNFRGHPTEQRKALIAALSKIGWIQDVIINTTTGHLIDGHLRCEIALNDEEETVPTTYVELTEDEEKIALASYDPIGELAFADQGILDDLIHGIGSTDNDDLDAFLQGLLGDDEPSETDEQADARETLQERFLIPPFSVLDAKQGYWKQRKDAWMRLGIKSELGRGNGDDKTQAGLTYAVSSQPPGVYEFKNKVEATLGRKLSWAEFVAQYPEEITLTGTSIFDPVLCEVAYSWFCPPGGSILDPFAGGSVRGITAAFLGYHYHGNDLREEQITANRAQALDILQQPIRKPSKTIPAPRITTHQGIRVLRDDDVFGGTKRRALARVLKTLPYDEFVYASPAYGFAQIALAAAASDIGKKATICVAKRKRQHPRTQAAVLAGANLIEVDHGYLSHTQARAKAYAEENGAHYVEFGLDNQAFIDALADIARETGENPTEVWTVAGSGVLTRALQQAWPEAEFHAVQIGKDPDIGKARAYQAPEKFEDPAKHPPPFESCDSYDAKAWQFIEKHASPGALFWNVAGNISHFDIFQTDHGTATWTAGDSRNIQDLAPGSYDLIFSCPPYADLEVYSDDPDDLSTLEYGEFTAAYSDIIKKSCALLKPNRFAVFVVGEVRNKRGHYYGFVQDTIKAFEAAGLAYYNEAVLLTNIGSNAMRAGGMFTNSRKLAKGHQNALVFAKGAPELSDIKGLSRAIANHFGEYRQIFQAFDNIMIFCNGDPKQAAEAIGEHQTIDLETLALQALDTSD